MLIFDFVVVSYLLILDQSYMYKTYSEFKVHNIVEFGYTNTNVLWYTVCPICMINYRNGRQTVAYEPFNNLNVV